MKPSQYYLHYKNKPYKYLGIAKHSETLEELVVYKCLYDNDMGELWVRPKDMFFETVQVDQKQAPRFAEVTGFCALKLFDDLKNIPWEQLEELEKNIFGSIEFGRHRIEKRIEGNTFHLIVAILNDQWVGFKLAYSEDGGELYSWLGGVDPSHRGKGVATQLMSALIYYGVDRKYKTIKTHTKNKFKEMIKLNLKFGFDIVDTKKNEHDDLRIVMQKELTKPG